LQQSKIESKAGYTCIGFCALVLWALSAVIVSELDRIPTLELTAIVFFMAFLISAGKLCLFQQWKRIIQPKYIYVIGAFALFVNQIGYVYAIKCCPPEQAEVIYYLWPIIVLFISSYFIEKNGHTIIALLSASLGLIGIYLLLTDGQGLGEIRPENTPGYFFALLSALAWVVFSLFTRYNPSISLDMNGIWCGLAVPVAWILHLMTEETVIPSNYEWALMTIIGIGILTISLLMWSAGMRHGHITILGALSYATPLISIAMLIFTGKTVYRHNLIIACQLVMLGGCLCCLLEWFKHKWEKEKLLSETKKEN